MMTIEPGKMRDLEKEIEVIRGELEEARAVLDAIGAGAADALVIQTADGPRVYTLQSADQPYRTLVETLKEGALTTNSDGVLLYCNEAFARLVGCEGASLLGLPLSNFVDGDIGALTTGDGATGLECFVRPSGGARRDCLISSARHQADHETVWCFVVTDVTGQHLRLRLASIVDTTDDAVISVNLAGRIASWNRAAVELFGYSADEAIGQDANLLALSRDTGMGGIASALSGASFRSETKCVTKDGTVLDVSATDTPIRALDGSIIGVSTIKRDITPRKRTEAAKKESEKRLQLALDVAEIGAWETDLTSGTAIWTAKVFDMLGIDRECTASIALFLSCVHPDDIARVQERFNTSIAGRTLFNEDFRIRRPNGEIRHIVGVGQVSDDADGKPTRMVGVNYDVTPRARHLEQIELLMREVSHRSMNMLAIVQAIATRSATSQQGDFLKNFGQRIQGLAANQVMLIKNDWKAILLIDLVRSQLHQFGDVLDSRFVFDGPPLRIKASASQGLGMSLHELATNAAKYGALSNESGRVRVCWGMDCDAKGGPRFAISWVESDGPLVEKPSRHGFGSTVLHSMTKMSFDGDVVIDFAPTGLEWRFNCPAEKMIEIGGEPG